jgi:hypothetical protein
MHMHPAGGPWRPGEYPGQAHGNLLQNAAEKAKARGNQHGSAATINNNCVAVGDSPVSEATLGGSPTPPTVVNDPTLIAMPGDSPVPSKLTLM